MPGIQEILQYKLQPKDGRSTLMTVRKPVDRLMTQISHKTHIKLQLIIELYLQKT